MAFADPDPLEQDMGVMCENMNPDQLVAYIKSYQDAFGLTLKVEGTRERSVFRSLQRIYGPGQAGLVVKWAFWKYRGRFRDEPIGFFMFSKGNKWWTDKLHMEVQVEMKKSESRSYAGTGLGVTNLADL